ncbi:hypothetical protein LMH87_009272 [Akanthomyces muscarius]|uniref:Uncharacterized protein n=1 Tax=Akanthomyces muscarius TaxID=2231603 RepID=A0A9W8QDK7_AKAMU|nr:hypothetical protein LMH87_009272 [Akanthomyces muscarius]KAJ4152751.1 hypothetical protein LMH87_009272 [Akanthomyces muscarius]
MCDNSLRSILFYTSKAEITLHLSLSQHLEQPHTSSPADAVAELHRTWLIYELVGRTPLLKIPGEAS